MVGSFALEIREGGGSNAFGSPGGGRGEDQKAGSKFGSNLGNKGKQIFEGDKRIRTGGGEGEGS